MYQLKGSSHNSYININSIISYISFFKIILKLLLRKPQTLLSNDIPFN